MRSYFHNHMCNVKYLSSQLIVHVLLKFNLNHYTLYYTCPRHLRALTMTFYLAIRRSMYYGVSADSKETRSLLHCSVFFSRVNKGKNMLRI